MQRDNSNIVAYLAFSLNEGIGQGHKKVDKETEGRLAQAFGEACSKQNFREGNGYIMAFDGKAYKLIDDKTIESIIVQVLEERKAGIVYTVNSVTAIRRHIERKIVKPFLPKKHLIAFDNCVLDMEKNQTFSFDESLQTNICMSFDYDPKADCPRFKSFLNDVLPDSDTLRALQEFCGAMFVDRRKYKIENIMYLVGTGQNGKSTFATTLQYLLGSENYTSFEVEDLTRQSTREYNIATMNGKLANICTDMSKGDISGGKFNTLVSGENVMGRFAFGRPFTASELPLIIANVNEIPVTTDHTFAHHRRPIPIPFRVRISDEKKDMELSYKLEQEVSGIFNWVYEGRQRFIKNRGKFTESELIKEEKEKIRIESNSVLQFLDFKEYSPKDSAGATKLWISVKEIYEDYIDFCKEWGKKNMFEKVNMGKILLMDGYEATRNSRGRGYVVYMGGKTWEERQKEVKDDLPADLPF